VIRYDLIDYRDSIITARKRALKRKITKAELEIYDEIIDVINKEILSSSGLQTSSGISMSMFTALEVVFAKFREKTSLKIIAEVAKDIDKITRATNSYYFGILSLEKAVIEGFSAVAEQTLLRVLGLGARGGILRGGLLDAVSKAPSLRDKVFKFIYEAYAQGMKAEGILDGVDSLMKTDSNKNGALVQQYAPIIYDAYQQYERQYNVGLANYLGLRCFVYAGGLIETSRDFCINRNNKVFTIWEAEEWVNADDLLLTNEEKRRGTPIDYVPMRDLGRWRCRHMINFITDNEAIRIRPQLKQILKTMDEKYGTVNQSKYEKG
jgi:hypothetical protein